MTITMRPKAGAASASAEQFISRAPDSGHDEAATQSKRRKETISLGVDPVLLKKVDVYANRRGISRAAAIALAISRLLDRQE